MGLSRIKKLLKKLKSIVFKIIALVFGLVVLYHLFLGIVLCSGIIFFSMQKWTLMFFPDGVNGGKEIRNPTGPTGGAIECIGEGIKLDGDFYCCKNNKIKNLRVDGCSSSFLFLGKDGKYKIIKNPETAKGGFVLPEEYLNEIYD